jgi:adenosylcobinamide-phosphate synthase
VANALMALGPDAALLGLAVAADLAIGDPSYAAHPVRLIGWTLTRAEAGLRRLGADGYAGGVALFLILGAGWTGTAAALVVAATRVGPLWGRLAHLFLLYSLLALGDLLKHGGRVEAALTRGDLTAARAAVAQLVGRDISRMDEAACRRAVIESWSENLTDGFVSPMFWYVLAGLPGLVLFKVVSTMDSMVGYKTPPYLRFGWCGARLDDVMNFVPARLTWLLLALTAAFLPGGSSLGALRIGLRQHGVLPSPNSGWSEAAAAGAIRRRIVGPIWKDGVLVTELWLGDPSDPPASAHDDVRRAAVLVVGCGLLTTAIAIIVVLAVFH